MSNCKANTIKLTNLVLPSNYSYIYMLEYVKANELYMPKTIKPNEQIGKISKDIKEIYCNKEWEYIINKNIY